MSLPEPNRAQSFSRFFQGGWGQGSLGPPGAAPSQSVCDRWSVNSTLTRDRKHYPLFSCPRQKSEIQNQNHENSLLAGKGGKTMAREVSRKSTPQTTRMPLPLSLHTCSLLSKWNPMAQSICSLFLWISKRNLQDFFWYRVNTVFLHHLHLLPKQCRDV